MHCHKFSSKFPRVIIDVEHVDVQMKRFDSCSSSKNFQTSRSELPNYIELCLVHIFILASSADMHGANIRPDTFDCPRIFDKCVRSDPFGFPQVNFLPQHRHS
jgi:hypothetical protein